MSDHFYNFSQAKLDLMDLISHQQYNFHFYFQSNFHIKLYLVNQFTNVHLFPAVMYQMVVGGKTFDAHLQLMAEVQAQMQCQVQLISCSQDGQVLIVFCPITSRTGADVDGAMRNVTGKQNVRSNYF